MSSTSYQSRNVAHVYICPDESKYIGKQAIMLMCMYVYACFMGLINTPHMNCTPAGERDSKPRLLNHEFLVWFHWCNVLAQRIRQLNIQLVHIKSNYNSCVVSKSSVM